jgi:hypothetical protein
MRWWCQALRNVEPGFTRPEEVQLMRILIYPAQVKEPEQVMRMQSAMLDTLTAIPGVTSVGLASSAPLEGLTSGDVLYAAGEGRSHRRTRSVLDGPWRLAVRMRAYWSII